MRLAALIGLLATAGLVALLWSGPAGRARLGLPAGWGGITEPAAAPSPAALPGLPGLPAHSRDLAPGTRTVHKCVVDGRVSYSDDAQCGGHGQALRIDMGANVLPSVAPAASAAGPAQAELSPAPAHPSRRPPGP